MESANNMDWIMFEGRMVRRGIAEQAERLRKQPAFYAGPGSYQALDPDHPTNRAQRLLEESHQEYLKIQRKKKRDAERQAEYEARMEALSVNLPLTPVHADPEVAELRRRIEAESKEARGKVDAAEEAHARAKAAFEEADRAAIEAEIQVELENASADDAKKARAAADKAEAALARAEAALKEAEREARRQAQRTTLLEERLRAAESRAEEELHREGKRLLREAIATARVAIAAAAEANEELYRVALALDGMKVPFTHAPHFRPLLRSALTGGPLTEYDAWLSMLGTYYPEALESAEEPVTAA